MVPPEGLCSGGSVRAASYQRGTTKYGGTKDGELQTKNNNASSFEEPAQVVGASLLLVIRAKNAPREEFGNSDDKGHISDASLAKRSLAKNSWFDGLTISHLEQEPKSKGQQLNQQQQEQASDVLAYSSRLDIPMSLTEI